MAYPTLTVCPLGSERETVKTALAPPESPSVTVTSSIESVGVGSSSAIVPVLELTPGVAFDGASSETANDSDASSNASSRVWIEICLVVSPGSKVTEPLCAV